MLAYPKFRLSNEEQHELLADYLPYTAAVRIPQPPPKVPPCRDADDLKFLELAVAGRARALVTGDADLLAVSGPLRFEIAAPAQWLVQIDRAPCGHVPHEILRCTNSHMRIICA